MMPQTWHEDAVFGGICALCWALDQRGRRYGGANHGRRRKYMILSSADTAESEWCEMARHRER